MHGTAHRPRGASATAVGIVEQQGKDSLALNQGKSLRFCGYPIIPFLALHFSSACITPESMLKEIPSCLSLGVSYIAERKYYHIIQCIFHKF